MVGGGDNGGAVGFRKGCARVGQKMKGLLSLKHVQRRDVRAQRYDVPEGEAGNVVTWQRGYKSNVATLRSNVATFQRGIKLTSRR